MKSCKTLVTLSSIVLALAAPVASQAAEVLCPGALGLDGGNPGITVTRQIKVTGALAGGECYYQLGNLQGDDVSDYLGADYDFLAKNGANEPGFNYGINNPQGATSGTWTTSATVWDTYAEVFLGFHFGNGSGDPDSFLIELNPGDFTGNWALIPVNLANGLSNIYLFGRGDASSSSGSTSSSGGASSSGDIPEPNTGSMALLGLGLLAGSFAWRRHARRV